MANKINQEPGASGLLPTDSVLVWEVMQTPHTRHATIGQVLGAMTTLPATFASIKVGGVSLVPGPSTTQFNALNTSAITNNTSLTSIQSRVTSLQARVAALEGGGTVGNITINNIPDQATGTAFTVSGQITGLSVQPTFEYQDNAGTWLPFPGGTTSSAPAPAAAVGYLTRTFGPDMTLEADSNNPTGKNWSRFSFFGTPWQNIIVTQNVDGSLTMNTGNMGNNYGGQLCSATYSPTTSPYIKGHAFGGGAYFEAVFSFTGTPNITGCSFWSNDIEAMAGGSKGDLTLRHWPGQVSDYGDWIEFDHPEFDTASTSTIGIGIHNWYGNVANTQTNTTFNPVTLPGPPDFSQPHKYGFLWVTASSSIGTQTNLITNFAEAGVVIGTPGSIPTGWDFSSQFGAMSRQIVATGTDAVTGNAYFDIRIFGTSNGSDVNMYFVPPSGVIVKPSFNYTQTVRLAIVAGGMTSIGGFALNSDNLDSAGNYISGNSLNVSTPTGTLSTFSNVFTTTSGTGKSNPKVTLGGMTNGGAVNITIRISTPQLLEQTISGQGYAKWFFDDVQIGTTVTWSQYDPANPPPPQLGTSAFSVADVRHFAIILGLGSSTNPMTIYSASVWQTDASQNIVL